MADDAVVEFRSDDDTLDAVLRLAYHPADDDFGTLAVEIRAGGLSCDEGVVSIRGDGLDSFLASLAADWQGWEGTRTWHTLEYELRIEATHHRNRVELLFIVARAAEPYGWEVRLPILVAPGESLSRLARKSADLF